MVGFALQGCDQKRPVPILAISGTDDPVTAYSGDPNNVGGWALLGQDDTIACGSAIRTRSTHLDGTDKYPQTVDCRRQPYHLGALL